MAKKFVRTITDTDIKKEPFHTNKQNDLISDDRHSYIRNKEEYHCLTDNIKTITSDNKEVKISKYKNNAKINIDFPSGDSISEILSPIIVRRDIPELSQYMYYGNRITNQAFNFRIGERIRPNQEYDKITLKEDDKIIRIGELLFSQKKEFNNIYIDTSEIRKDPFGNNNSYLIYLLIQVETEQDVAGGTKEGVLNIKSDALIVDENGKEYEKLQIPINNNRPVLLKMYHRYYMTPPNKYSEKEILAIKAY